MRLVSRRFVSTSRGAKNQKDQGGRPNDMWNKDHRCWDHPPKPFEFSLDQTLVGYLGQIVGGKEAEYMQYWTESLIKCRNIRYQYYQYYLV